MPLWLWECHYPVNEALLVIHLSPFDSDVDMNERQADRARYTWPVRRDHRAGRAVKPIPQLCTPIGVQCPSYRFPEKLERVGDPWTHGEHGGQVRQLQNFTIHKDN